MKIGELFDVTGLVTIITGGASGIGLGIAEAMAENGAKVFLFDRNDETVHAEVERLRGDGYDVRGALVDVTDADGLAAAFDAVKAEAGRVDVAFVNAGIGGGPGFLKTDNTRNTERLFEDLPVDQLEGVLSVNVVGAFLTIQQASRIMREQKAGRIIVTSSVSAFRTEPHVGTPYVVSKGAVGQLVRQAAFELAREGINVNAIAPGPFITNISGGRLQDPEVQAPFAKLIPMHRMGTPADVQGLALFLASPASSYITGAHIFVDGGGMLGIAD